MAYRYYSFIAELVPAATVIKGKTAQPNGSITLTHPADIISSIVGRTAAPTGKALVQATDPTYTFIGLIGGYGYWAADFQYVNVATLLGTTTQPSGEFELNEPESVGFNAKTASPIGSIKVAEASRYSLTSISYTIPRPTGAIGLAEQLATYQLVVSGVTFRPTITGGYVVETDKISAIAGVTTSPKGPFPVAEIDPAHMLGATAGPTGKVTLGGSGKLVITGALSRPAGALHLKETDFLSLTGTAAGPTGKVTLGRAGVLTISGTASRPSASVKLAGIIDLSVKGSASRPVGAITAHAGYTLVVDGIVGRPLGVATLHAKNSAEVLGATSMPLGRIAVTESDFLQWWGYGGPSR